LARYVDSEHRSERAVQEAEAKAKRNAKWKQKFFRWWWAFERTGLWLSRGQRLQLRVTQWRMAAAVATARARRLSMLWMPEEHWHPNSQGIYKAWKCINGGTCRWLGTGWRDGSPNWGCYEPSAKWKTASVWRNPVWDECMDLSRSIGPRHEYYRVSVEQAFGHYPLFSMERDRWEHRRIWLRRRLAEWRAACGITGKRCDAYRLLRAYRTVRIYWAFCCWKYSKENGEYVSLRRGHTRGTPAFARIVARAIARFKHAAAFARYQNSRAASKEETLFDGRGVLERGI